MPSRPCQELILFLLVKFAKSKGLLKEVTLVVVTVRNLDGTDFKILLDQEENQVKLLKTAIQERQGIPRHRQELFLLPNEQEEDQTAPVETEAEKGKEVETEKDTATNTATGTATAPETATPLEDEDTIASTGSVTLCVEPPRNVLKALYHALRRELPQPEYARLQDRLRSLKTNTGAEVGFQPSPRYSNVQQAVLVAMVDVAGRQLVKTLLVRIKNSDGGK